MGLSIAEKIIKEHLVEGEMQKGAEIGIKIDQTLTQDATGTMAYLQFEALEIPRVKTELSASYVDHNLLQTDFRNADDHRYLQTVAAKYGVYFSRPGNGICHQVHLERFGAPGKTLLGSDSHTPTNGGLGMIAIGAGGLDVALAMAGEPFHLKMPKIVGVELTGKLMPWVSGKDLVLELLKRLSVKGGVDKIMEYFGPGVKTLSTTSRATVCNFGAELGATTSVFPSDENTRRFLESQSRGDAWRGLSADPDAEYDEIIKINLEELEPLIACPTSPDNVMRVADVEGEEVAQVIIGSCGNSSYQDLMITAKTLEGKRVHPNLCFDINPGSRQVLENLVVANGMMALLKAGARIHQPGCMGCIGMGQAPPTDAVSLRTFSRNFPGRSGTEDDQVYLCSPEVAVASAIKGVITDPRSLGEYPKIQMPDRFIIDDGMIIPPQKETGGFEVIRGPNIKPLPRTGVLEETIGGEVLLKVGDNITTDHIMPAGAKILPLRSNIPAISEHVYESVDPTFPKRAKEKGGGFIVGGENYGQGSSREHAALAPMYLGVKAIVAKSFARIHRANLINFGILPLVFSDPDLYETISKGDQIEIGDIRDILANGKEEIPIIDKTRGSTIITTFEASQRDRDILLAGGLLNLVRDRIKGKK
ncbi:MAG: aconitate hydratase [Candidatus Hydrothermarchaeales archaeon]